MRKEVNWLKLLDEVIRSKIALHSLGAMPGSTLLPIIVYVLPVPLCPYARTQAL